MLTDKVDDRVSVYHPKPGVNRHIWYDLLSGLIQTILIGTNTTKLKQQKLC